MWTDLYLQASSGTRSLFRDSNNEVDPTMQTVEKSWHHISTCYSNHRHYRSFTMDGDRQGEPWSIMNGDPHGEPR